MTDFFGKLLGGSKEDKPLDAKGYKSSFKTAKNSKNRGEDDDEESEESGLLETYAGKLKESLTSNILISKSKGLIQGAQDKVQTSINITKNLPYIIILIVAGTLFLLMAFMYLPLVLLFPTKFSFSFGVATLCYLVAISLMKDPTEFFMSFLREEKRNYTLAYIASLAGMFYFSLVAKSYLMSLFFCGAQVISLAWVIATSIPGGLSGMGYLSSMCKKFAGSLLGNVFKSKENQSFLPV